MRNPLVAARIALLAGFILAGGSATAWATVNIKDRTDDSPLVLNEPTDYVLSHVSITNLRDMAAVTLVGKITSVVMDSSEFGKVTSGPNGHAAALEAAGATIGSFRATDCRFFDAENQLASLREGSFGTVVFERCSFQTTDAFLKNMYETHPWHMTPPVTEFSNIDRLELLDNTFINTIVVIAPSVKTVVLRGDLTGIRIADPATQVIVMPAEKTPVGTGALAGPINEAVAMLDRACRFLIRP